jgi:hypothetical protein
MSKIAAKLASIRNEITRPFTITFFGHRFTAKFLSEKEEQLIMEYISKANLADYKFISKLSTLQLAFSLVSIDDEPVYTPEDIKDDQTFMAARLAIVDNFESWDSDVLFSFLKEIKAEREKVRVDIAKQAGLSDDDIAKLTKSTLDQITGDADLDSTPTPPELKIEQTDGVQPK